jgi:hypothetical protein
MSEEKITYRIEALEDNTILAFAPDSDVPSMTFPAWPSGDPWLDADEGKLWADRIINQGLQVPQSPYGINNSSEERLPLL